MEKKLALLCCLFTILIVGSCSFIVNKTIDFPTILLALKFTVPAAIVAYFCGLYMGKTLSKAKVDTEILNTEVQQQFVDDLLLSPDEVLNRTTYSEMLVQEEIPSEENSQEEIEIKEN